MKLKLQIYGLCLWFQYAPIDTSIRAILVEMYVTGVLR
jgi:hypothetical protein